MPSLKENPPTRPTSRRVRKRSKMRANPKSTERSLLLNVYQRFDKDDGFPLSGNIAFSFLLAFFPFLIFLTALAGFFGNAELAQTAVNYLLSVFPSEIVDPIADDINALLTAKSGGILTLSIAITLYAAGGGVESVRTGLNRAYGYTEKRRWVSRVSQNIAFVIVGAVVMIILAVFIVFAPLWWGVAVRWFPPLDEFTALFDFIRYPVALGVMFMALLLGHLLLPRRRQKIRRLLPGIALTMALWLLSAWTYAEYTARFSRAQIMYAGLGNVVIALVFVYLSALLILLGAEFNRALIVRAEEAEAVKTGEDQNEIDPENQG